MCCGLCCCGWLLLALRSRVGTGCAGTRYGRWPYRPGLGIRVDSYLNTKDTDMQRRGLGKLDHDLSVCLPTIVADERLKMFGKHLSVEFVLAAISLVVRGAELQGVAVGDQDGPVPRFSAILGLRWRPVSISPAARPGREDTEQTAFDAAFELCARDGRIGRGYPSRSFLRRVYIESLPTVKVDYHTGWRYRRAQRFVK